MLQKLTYALWFSAPPLHCAIAVCMWLRRLHTQYPLFFLYTFFHVVSFPIVLYFFRLGSRELYRYTFVSHETADAVLKFAVTCELFSHVFRPYRGIRGLGWILLKWGGVILLLLSAAVAARTTGSDTDRFLAGLFAIMRSAQIVQGGLVFLLLLASATLGLQWEQPGFGMILGFGLVASVNLVAYTLRLQFGDKATDILSVIAFAGYDCAVVIWLMAVWVKRAVHQFKHGIPSWDVEAWNRALLNMLRQ